MWYNKLLSLLSKFGIYNIYSQSIWFYIKEDYIREDWKNFI